MDSRLMDAAKKGELQLLKQLLDCGGNIDTKQYSGYNLLHTAVIGRQIDCIAFLLERAPHLAMQKSDLGDTPLLYACSMLNVDVIRALCQVKETIDIVDEKGRTPLHIVASHYEGPKCAEVLLGSGADINVVDMQNFTTLYHAICSGNIDTVRLLLRHGATITSRDLMQIDIRHSWQIALLLLEHDSTSVHSQSSEGYTFLMRVSRCGDVEQISSVLAKGAEVNSVSKLGVTALMEAVKSENLTAVQLLIDAGADLTVVNGMGQSLLSIACLLKFNPEPMLRFLLENEPFKSGFVHEHPEHHPQSMVLRKVRSPDLLKIILQSPLKDVNLVNKEDFMNENFLKIFDSDQMALGPISYLLNNPEQITESTTLKMLQMLIDAGYSVNQFGNTVPPLTILMSCKTTYVRNDTKFMHVVECLLSKGARVDDMSLKIVTQHPVWREVKRLREEMLLPDALLITLRTKNPLAVRRLLPYSPVPPLTLLLLLCPEAYETGNLGAYFKMTVGHGLPLGTSLCRELTKFLRGQHSIIQPYIWPRFSEMLDTPPTLTDLAKFATRERYVREARARRRDLMGLLEEVIPVGLRKFVLLTIPQENDGPVQSVSRPSAVHSNRRLAT